MSSHSTFHLATKKQLSLIKDGLDRISPQIWILLGDVQINLYIRYFQEPEIYLVPIDLEQKLRLIRDYSILFHTGRYFGFLKGNEFMLSLEGAEFIFEEFFTKNYIKLKTITVSEDTAKSFLYGNTLKYTDFIHAPSTLNKKDLIFVLNPQNQFIGIGYIYKRQEHLELRNLVDYGYYIRRGF